MLSVTSQARTPQQGGTETLQVQLLFSDYGDHAARVDGWLTAHYPHLVHNTSAQPGLCVAVHVPGVPDAEWEGWHGALVASLSPLDVACELLAQCFADLGLEPLQPVSLHVSS